MGLLGYGRRNLPAGLGMRVQAFSVSKLLFVQAFILKSRELALAMNATLK
jgi:hypothetical protein